jgi:ElaB/YqjD/DUF883 family membrane-anchored ribosome-binding protein
VGEDERQVREAVAADERTPEQIQADIERTRREMGDTVAAVAEKADVKTQAKTKIQDARARLTGKKDEVLSRTREAAPDSAGEGADKVARVARDNRRPLAIGGAVLAAFLLGRMSGRE